MANPPTVSVCMPASRPSTMFDEALASVLSQTLDDLEVIVTDDSGGDLRPSVQRTGDERIRYLPNPRPLGLSGNHCRAIDRARGRYVAVLHDDDSWVSTYLDAATTVLESHPPTGLVISATLDVTVDGQILRRRPAGMVPGVQDDALGHLLRKNFIMMLPSATLWRREALDCNHRPWPDLVNADVTAFVDPIVAGWQLHYLAEPLVRYRVHGGQIGAVKQFLHRDGLVKIWSSYRFADSRHELQRQRLLTECYLARAGAHLRTGNVAQAQEDIALATRTDKRTERLRRTVLAALCKAPRLIAPASAARSRLRRRHTPVGATATSPRSL